MDEPPDKPAPLTARELQLVHQLEQKQKEVIELTQTIDLLTSVPTARPPPIPKDAQSSTSLFSSLPLMPSASASLSIPSSLTTQSPSILSSTVDIPPTFVPVLNRIREITSSLVGENARLRSLLTSQPGPLDSADNVEPGEKIDLQKVVGRLKVLVEENEELGQVLAEVGKDHLEVNTLRALVDDCHQAILALDADLDSSHGQIAYLHHLLSNYCEQFGPLDPSRTKSFLSDFDFKDKSASDPSKPVKNRAENRSAGMNVSAVPASPRMTAVGPSADESQNEEDGSSSPAVKRLRLS